jgi:hypothetical protein
LRGDPSLHFTVVVTLSAPGSLKASGYLRALTVTIKAYSTVTLFARLRG